MNVQETFDAIVAIANEPLCSRSIERENVWIDHPMMRHGSVVRTIAICKEDVNRIVYEEKTEIKPDFSKVVTVNTKIIILAFDGAVHVTTGTTVVYDKIYNNNLNEFFEHTALFKNHLYFD